MIYKYLILTMGKLIIDLLCIHLLWLSIFLFFIDNKKIIHGLIPEDKIMVLFMRIQEVNGYLLSLFGCLKIKMEMRENEKTDII